MIPFMCKLSVIINAHQIKKFTAYEALPIPRTHPLINKSE